MIRKNDTICSKCFYYLSIQCLGPKKTKSSDNLWGICERDKSPTQEKSKDEDALLEKIFSYEATVKIYNENQKLFEKLMSEHKETLQEQLDDSHIQFHPRLVLMAIALYLLAVSGAAWWLHDGGMSAGMDAVAAVIPFPNRPWPAPKLAVPPRPRMFTTIFIAQSSFPES